MVLVLSVAAAGIWITHKVAGPLFSIEGICARVRDNKLAPSLRQQLRRGDELQDFYSTFRDMYEALRTRADRDVQVLGEAIARLEQTGADGGRGARFGREAARSCAGTSRAAWSREPEAAGSGRRTSRVCAALTRHRPCRNSPGSRQQA